MIYFRLVVLGVIWGSSFLAQKIALEGWTYQQVVIGRIASAAIVLGTIVLIQRSRVPRSPTFWFHISVSGGLIAAANFFILLALTEASSSLAGILVATTPLFAAAFVFLLLRNERPTWLQGGGLLAGFGGAAIAIEPWQQGLANSRATGFIALLLSAALLGLNNAYLRRYVSSRTEGSMTVMAAAMITGTVGLAAIVGPTVSHQPWSISPVPIFAVLYLGIVPTGLAYVLLFGLIRDAGSLFAASSNYLIPVVAVILGVTVLGEPLQPSGVIGGVMVLLGVALIEGRLGSGKGLPSGFRFERKVQPTSEDWAADNQRPEESNP
jgi:drug/metabolite transporter (DMT)-like permease